MLEPVPEFTVRRSPNCSVPIVAAVGVPASGVIVRLPTVNVLPVSDMLYPLLALLAIEIVWASAVSVVVPSVSPVL